MMGLILAMSMMLPQGSWHHGDILPWYGPSFYGNRTACGLRMTRTLVGIASRTMKCGTKITIRWHGRTLKARIVDAGPYPAPSLYDNMPFDLTAGAAKKLGCSCSNPHFTRHDFIWKRGW